MNDPINPTLIVALDGKLFENFTLRDLFAVLERSEPAECTVEEAAKELGIPTQEYDYRKHYQVLLVRHRYKMADEMLTERKYQEKA